MGNHVSCDAVPLEDLVSYRPAPDAPLPPLKYRSNLKAWRFFATESPLQVHSTPIDQSAFRGFDANECYIVLHIYSRHDNDGKRAGSAPPSDNPTASGATRGSSGDGQQSVSQLAANGGELLSPRGLSGPFSGYDDCGPYPFEQRVQDAERGPLAHDLYIWNGRTALALTKAVALTKCFELERALINDEVGAIHFMHRGLTHPQPLAAAFAADYALSGSSESATGAEAPPGENHLLSTLCRHADASTIPCSALLACMLPGLSSLSTAAFPALQKALYAHAKPTGSAPTSPATTIAPPSVANLGAPPSIAAPTVPGISGLSKLTGLGAAASAPPTAHAGAPPAIPPVAIAAAIDAPVSKPARPGSAGARGARMPALGLSNLPKLQPADESSAPSEPKASGAPAIPRLGGSARAGGLPAGMGLDLAGLQSAYDRGDIEPNELTSKAEKLRFFNGKCSKITESLFLGADTVARDKELLLQNGVTHVLNTASVACKNYHEGTFTYRALHLHDTPREDIAPVMYSAIEFIDAAIEAGGKVYVHCHQGVSRSTSMATAYYMWKNDLQFDEAFAHIKERRGIASPNAGFICRLLQLHKDLHPVGPPDPPRLFRLTPFVGGPVARAVETSPLSHELLDARMCAVLYGATGLFVWVGDKAHPEYLTGARAWAAQLVKFEKAPPPLTMRQGEVRLASRIRPAHCVPRYTWHSLAFCPAAHGLHTIPALLRAPQETGAFWELLGGEGPVAGRVPAYDKDYGVGTVPTIPLPEIEVQLLPTIGAPLSLAGGPAGGLVPGIHTTAEDGVGDALAPLPSARGERPPIGGLGLAKLAAPLAAEPPPPTPRGGRSFADIPRVADPLPTPRGGRPEPLPAMSTMPPPASARGRGDPDETDDRTSKKARDVDEDDGNSGGDAGGGDDHDGKAELYAAPGASGDGEWENLSMFDSDDLDENGTFLLLCYNASGAAVKGLFWVGGESPLSYERDSDIVEVAHDFLQTKGMGELPITLVFQGDEEESFWAHFVNG